MNSAPPPEFNVSWVPLIVGQFWALVEHELGAPKFKANSAPPVKHQIIILIPILTVFLAVSNSKMLVSRA